MKKTLLLLLLPCALGAQNNTSALDSYMQGQASLYGFSGNVLVSKNGQVIYKRSFGFADNTTKKKLDDNSVFDCGSIAKEFTAMAILLLKDKGMISYTDTLRKFFPGLPYTNVTVQQLLTHTSGMPDGFGLLEKHFDHKRIATNDDLIRLLESEKPALLFKPGENLAYSGTAFNLLASIVEKLSGQSFPTYMEEKIFKPLGMTNTRVANWSRSPGNIPGYAYGYVYNDSLKKYVRADSLQSDWTTYLLGITGEGMIVTTTGDLLKWDLALKNNRLLSAPTQKEMLSLQSEKAFPKVGFGYGMRVGKNDIGNYIFHNGYYPGYVCMHIRYTDEDLAIIVLSNNESRSDFIADGLATICLNKKILLPYVHKETSPGAGIGKYTGKYWIQLTRPPYMAVFPIEFIQKNNFLFIHPGSGPDIQLMPESANKFFFGNKTDQQIEFETDNTGNLIKVWQIVWGIKRELKKIE